jgi:CPA2 family monovalent cation:H+ antiporter-2
MVQPVAEALLPRGAFLVCGLVLNIGGGLALGFALGWGTSEAVVIAGTVGISSSAM